MNTLRGKAWRVGDNVDTDQIIAGRYLSLTDPDELRRHCFEEAYPNLAQDFGQGDIIVAGENVSPGEIGEVLSSHPDVFEAAVLGEPSEKHGEVPVAYVALQEGKETPAKELIAWCRERLAPFKVPRRVELRAELPHGPTGKVLKRAIREE